jgi:hypothetical protein
MANEDIINNAQTNNPGYFNEAEELKRRRNFSRREVGLTHPDNSAFIRLNDRGDIEIFSGEELGIVISPSTRSISLFADVVKIYTKEDYGLRWNNKSFNYAGDVYNEPALVETSEKDINSGFNYASYYLDNLNMTDILETDQNIVTMNGEFAFRDTPNQTVGDSIPVNQNSILNEENTNLLKEYSLTNSSDKVEYVKKLLELGFTFSQATEKTLRDKGV